MQLARSVLRFVFGALLAQVSVAVLETALMASKDGSELIDLIYRAAFDTDLWEPVMERFADHIGGNSAHLSGISLDSGGGSVITARIDPVMKQRYFDYYALKNPLSNVSDPDAYLRDWRLGINTDEDLMPREDLLASEFFNDYMRPQDAHACAMLRLATHGRRVYALTINRSEANAGFDQGDLDFARSIYPHLLRAFDMGQRLAETQLMAGNLADALETSQHGVFVLEDNGQVRRMNRKAESLLAESDGLRIANGRLFAGRPDLSSMLHGLIARATTAASRPLGGSMSLPTAGRRKPLSITVAPMRSERLAFFDNRPCAVLVVTDLDAGVAAPEQQLRSLFGLTKSEVRVAAALFDGLSAKEAADALGISIFTVRVQIGRIFEKTGVPRQAELVRLMMRIVGGNILGSQ